MKALTAVEMREVDRLTTERHGISSYQLMETAGTLAANAFAGYMRDAGLEPPHEICVLCGKGNNGGDGFVVARQLSPTAAGSLARGTEGTVSATAKVFVVLFAREEELRGDAATNFRRWREVGGEVVFVTDEGEWASIAARVLACDVVVDAMFGTGFRGAARGAIGRAIRDVNAKSKDATAVSPTLIFAVDMPSGLPSDGEAGEEPILKAHHTVTFTAPKVGQLVSSNSAAVGSLRVVNIGSARELVEEIGKSAVRWSDAGEFADMPLVRKSDGHKGLYGNILIVAGSLGKSGAAVMSGGAALRAGAGLVTIATPDVVLPIVAGAHPEYMTEALAATKDGTIARSNLGARFAAIAKGRTVLAIGPGLGQDEETQDFIRSVVKTTESPIILDADGLNAFARRSDELRERKSQFLAITPHPGEMARLLGNSVKDVEADRVRTATDAAKRWNAHVILKGAHTIIVAPDGRMLVNTTGNPGLAKGGSGDVLTGVLAAMTGQFKTDDWLRTLALGVYLHGAAADVAARGTDLSGMVASDVARSVPQARLELLRELQRRG
jgi:ADP-dependent NAD(P)H-hydrate dehydratase / NAD(P)H-hydrate epimerase